MHIPQGHPEPELVLSAVAARHPGRLRHVHRVPARAADHTPWPEWVAPPVLAAYAGSGITRLWRHQRQAADLARAGQHVVLSTGTASGKSLGYLIPGLTAVVDGASTGTGRGSTMLYLAPTKALAADQFDRIERLAVPGVRAATYDGDTPPDERRWIRDHANLVLTNPDLLHHSLLPGHDRWSSFLRALDFVVVDECHIYRGVFGAHVSAVLRRLRRVAARYRAEPTFVLASATIGAPAEHAARLIGMPVAAVEQDGSPREALTFALWEPQALPESEQGVTAAGTTPARRAATTESAELLADLVEQGVQAVAFARSRVGVEALAAAARRRLEVHSPELATSVAAYRGGYLPEERRAIEAAVRRGELRGLATTNALELGVDISGLDAVVVAGWPGRRASLWQQVGRAGRRGTKSLALFVAADDPLDTYLLTHPEAIFGQPIETAVMDPTNPAVLAGHLAAAAAELPLTPGELDLFGPTARRCVDALTERGLIRRRPSGWYWTRADRASDHVDLRGMGVTVSVVDQRTGRVVGTVDAAAAHGQVHTGAVHLHQGQSWIITDLDLASDTAMAVAGDPGWSTQAQSVSSFEIETVERDEAYGPVQVCFGAVRVTGQVTGFLRRLPGGEVIGQHPLDLPARTLPTQAVWWTIDPEALAAHGIDILTAPGALHAAEHAAIGMLPLLATCDRWDVGGVSTVLHPDTGLPTVMIYDGHPGGAGFARRAHADLLTWLGATLEAVSACPCGRGCPACVQSPKCGNGNEPLDKPGAIALLRLVIEQLGDSASQRAAGPDIH